MKRYLLFALFVTIVSPVFAKDHSSDYLNGNITVTQVSVNTGWHDSTVCSGGSYVGYDCSGGISEKSEQRTRLALILSDGRTLTFTENFKGSLGHWTDGPVQYRVERKRFLGKYLTTIWIANPDRPGKERFIIIGNDDDAAMLGLSGH